MKETKAQRKARERAKANMRQQMDKAAANVPDYFLSRLGQPSPLADAIVSETPNANDKFLQYTDDEEHQLIKPPERGPAGGKGKAAAADERCRDARTRNLKYWGLKHKAEQIAIAEGLSKRTVLRYFERMPK
ncbi:MULTISPECIES: hypothetical protein [unclassified Roseobacter]|uniref:hypothetical protein n=1 Tax=unclassified Roseobacter TaxID=196798 RepID=UPI001D24E193|nr:hypothetical protein [Rhodobacterales bacterium FZCC0069]MBF9024063.1 hypothetical protein [Rhodobacterales bacterium HKCCD6035]